jgi:hypothetical protein
MAKIEKNSANEKNKTAKKRQIDYFYVPRSYAKSKVDPIWSSNNTRTNKAFTKDQITTMLKNPYLNYKKLQMVSDYLLANNSNYENIVDYFANIMTFDYIIYPTDLNVKKASLKNRLKNSAKTISKITLESVFPHIMKQAILYGESYWYDLSDGENTIIEEIPRDICILSHIDDDNLWRYYVDLALIKSTNLYELPEELIRAYKKWIENGSPKGKRKEEGFEHLPESYYEVSNKGFSVFIHMNKKAHDYPLLAHMFIDLTTLGEDKSYFNDFTKEDAVKTVHQEVPVDKESGLPIMDYEVIEAYHNSAKEAVGKNISVMTSPFKVQGITLDNNKQSSINLVDHGLKVVQANSGISETIFNANTTNGLGYSTKADAARMYPLLYFFTNYINFKIKSQKFAVKFLKINIFNQEEMHEQYRTDLLSGGSRQLFMCSLGIDLYSYLNTLEMEDKLGFDDMLVAKVNGSQIGESSDNKNGRPEKKEEDKSDSTVTGSDYA